MELKHFFESDFNQLREEEVFINSESFYIDNREIIVLITKEKEYYNLYVIDDYFKKYPFNCLKEQIPITEIKQNEQQHFNKMFMELESIKHNLWFKYSNNENVLSFDISVNRD